MRLPPGAYRLIVTTTRLVLRYAMSREEGGVDCFRAFNQVTPSDATLIDNEDAVASRIVVEEVHVYQALDLNLQTGLLANFPDDGLRGTFI